MKSNIIAAAILAVGLIIAAFLHTGRYYVMRVDADTVVRVDRWTGKTKVIETESSVPPEVKAILGGNSN